MDPIAVRDEDYQTLFNLQKALQTARLEAKPELVKELMGELSATIHELYPESIDSRVRFDVSGRKIFFW